MFRVTCFFNFETDIPATTSLFAGCSNCNLGRGKYIFRELFLPPWTQNCEHAWFYLWRLLPLDGFRLLGLAGKIFTRSPVVVVAGPGLGNRLNDLLLEEQISSFLSSILLKDCWKLTGKDISIIKSLSDVHAIWYLSLPRTCELVVNTTMIIIDVFPTFLFFTLVLGALGR